MSIQELIEILMTHTSDAFCMAVMISVMVWLLPKSPHIDKAEQARNARAETLCLTIKMQHAAKMDELNRQQETSRLCGARIKMPQGARRKRTIK